MKRFGRLRRHVPCAVLLILALVGAFTSASSAQPSWQPTLKVSFLDVDQGDSVLFQGPDFTILVDAGRHDRSEVVPLLRAAGVRSIDLFVLTHPHADHIGQCDAVMKAFPVREVWMSGDVATTRTFERCVDAILASDAYYHEPRAGETFNIGSARIEIVHPAEVTGDFNNGSVGMRIVYGNVAFLLTGDAEASSEAAMIARGHRLKADVLHLGHHGSSTSSTLPFLQAVQPQIAVYSAGKGNPYGHPHREVIARLAALGIPVYGTDTHGTVTVLTDGVRWTVQTQRGSNPAAGTTFTAGAAAAACGPGQVNVNTASAEELTRIIHIGPALAERVIAGRPYATLDDLLRVSGIGATRLADIKAQGLACAGPVN